ncbi:MAG: tryptophan--tRNA ligase [Clostridia bacterium]|nr:tryptophan--tRNA ligase [Clostridia bacterium]
MKVLYSATKPTGKLTLGNYIGALQNWKKLQDEYQCYFCIANMHAHTINIDPKYVMENTYEQFAWFLACGFDIEKSCVYVQSMVPEHSEMCWLLNCNTMMGEASRMTQYKDHVAKGKESITTALFTYPVLMAGDILLFNTNVVPVGIDQVQHVELARDIAKRFNTRFGNSVVEPNYFVPKVGAKIMGLLNPEAKMGKSDDDPNNIIYLQDSEEEVAKKIKRAVTDSVGVIQYAPETQPGVSNLLTIIAVMENKSIEEVVDSLKGQNYGALKSRTTEAINNGLRDVREKYKHYMENKDELRTLMQKGADKARIVAEETLKRCKQAMGLL